MKRRNSRVIEAYLAERQETGCFRPGDQCVTGRTVLKEDGFRVTKGSGRARKRREVDVLRS